MDEDGELVEGAAEGDGNSAESCCATAVVTDETSVVISSSGKAA